MIHASHLTKTYSAFDLDRKDSGIGLWVKNLLRLTGNRASPVTALDDLSLDVAKGEVLGIFGANGAGKTTLIKILSGLLRADRGSLTIDGASDANAIKERISYVSTNGWMGLEWQLTTWENLLLYGQLFGLGNREIVRRGEAALDLLGLGDARQKYISQLSAGMRQKVTLARGLLLERPVLYLDEPTVSLDVQSAAQVRRIVEETARQEGRTVLVTSHNPLDLAACDRILFLHRGRAVAVGSHAQLLQPLGPVVALHITCGADESQLEPLGAELRMLAGVRSLHFEPGQSRRSQWILRVVVDETLNPVNGIIDCFIEHDLPILALQSRPVTLQELYEQAIRPS